MPPDAVDLRDLPPPEPLARIIDAMGSGGDGPLVFLLAREPRLLYPLLERDGWRHHTRRDERGFELTIERGGQAAVGSRSR